MKLVTLTFVFDKETKNAVKYRAANGAALTYNVLYLPKTDVPRPIPTAITVTIEDSY